MPLFLPTPAGDDPPERYVKDESFVIVGLLTISNLVWLDSTVQTWMSYQDYNPVGSPIVFPGTTTITMEDPFILDGMSTGVVVLDLTANPNTLFWLDAARYPGFTQYRFIKVTVFQTSGNGTWAPTGSTRLAFVECVGGGGAGGDAPVASANLSCGAGGGSGAYAASTLKGAAIKTTSFTIGKGGVSGVGGGVGFDTTWDTSVIVANGGNSGASLAAGTSVAQQQGGFPGSAVACTGDIKLDGGGGTAAMRFSATVGWGGNGGGAPIIGGTGGGGSVGITGGQAGVPGSPLGSGGGGAGTTSTAAAGGSGVQGMIRIWEYA